jgi:signal transduction histidine kinase/CHASE2 domain-containing sensor protein
MKLTLPTLPKPSPQVQANAASQFRRLSRLWRLRTGLLIGIACAVLMLIVLRWQLFRTPANLLTDALYTRSPISDKIVLIAVDDATLNAYGRQVAGWSRTLHGDLIRVVSEGGARVIAFDILFEEAAISDQALVEAILEGRQKAARTRTVLAIAGKGVVEPGQTSATDRLISFEGFPSADDPLLAAAAMLGTVNVFPDGDGHIRRVPMVVRQGETVYGSLAAVAYLQYLRVPADALPQLVTVNERGLTLTPQRELALDGFGLTTIPFFGPAGTFAAYTVSYRDVREGQVDPSIFRDKIVLVGMHNAAGATDRYLVPLDVSGELMSGVEIHAHIVEALLQNRSLRPVDPLLLLLTTCLVPIVITVGLSQLRWYWSLVMYAVNVTALFLTASTLFSTASLIFDWFYPLLGITLATAAILVAHIRWQVRSGRFLQQLLTGAERIIARRLTLDTMIPEVEDAVVNLLGYASSHLFLWETDTLVLEPASQSSTAREATLLPGPLIATATTTTSHEAKLHTVAKTALNTRKTLTQEAIVATPLTYQDYPIGVLVAEGRGSQSRERQVLLQLFAEQVAPALALARLNTLQLRQRDLLQAILSSTPDPVLVIDQAGNIVRTNPAAIDLFRTDGSRTHVSAFLSAHLGSEAVGQETPRPPALDELLKGDQPFSREFSFDKRHFSLRAAPLQRAESGWVLLLHDITALKNLDELRSRMLRMASHDLKNPLSVIKGYAELMLEDELTAAHHKMLSHVLTSSNRMFKLISDLLDSNRVRLGTLELVRLDFNVLAERTAQEFRVQAEDKKLTLTIDVATQPSWVLGDEPQLHETISNLISNAIKYTPSDGRVEITVTRYHRKVRLCVKDTGLGIPEEAQPHLFTPYYRVQSEATANITGTGLGLSIVKDVVDSHGGHVWVESKAGAGSAFYVELPLTDD